MDEGDSPLVTVIISTIHRPESLLKAIQTILESDYPHFEVIVVDQSENDLTVSSLEPFLGYPNIRYIKCARKGLSIGLNLGISHARSEFIAVLDDDCEAPPNWLHELAASFALDRRIGIVFGNVLAGPHDRTMGFIPTYVRKEPFLARSIWQKHRVESISASMALRKSLWHTLKGFDRMLGPGAPFRSAEESDFTVRTLLSSHFVHETPKVMVVHHGFRTWKQGRNLIYGYLYGIGAMMAKHLKCGHWPVIHFLLHLAWRWAFGAPIVDFGHQPSRGLRLVAFVQGFLAGAFTPVDRATGHFVKPKYLDFKETL